MPIPSPIPNTAQRKKTYAGTETTRGTAVTPTYKWYGDLVVTKRTPLADRDEHAGTYDVDYNPVYGPPEIDGTFAVPLAYQDLAIYPRYGVKGGVTGVTDGNPTPGYTYTYSPTAADDDLDSATLLHNFDGIVFESTGVLFNEFTVRANIDDAAAAWMWDSRLFLRTKDLVVAVDEMDVTSATASTLTATGTTWVVNGFAGQYVEILSGPSAGEVAKIVSNTATVLTIEGTWATNPTSGSTFEVSSEFPAGVSDRQRDTVNF